MVRLDRRRPSLFVDLSIWRQVCGGDLPPSQRPRPRYYPRRAVVVAAEPFDGDSIRVFEVLGSLRLSFPRAPAVLGGARDADANDEQRGGRNFSLMGYRRNYYCSGTTNFALEGVMRAKQFFDLRKAAEQLE